MRLNFMLPVFVLAAALASPASAQIKIATANPATIFDGIQEKKDMQSDLNAKLEQLKRDDKTQRDALEELKKQLGQVRSDSPQYNEINQKLLQGAIAYDAWTRIQQANAASQQKTMMVNLFKKISDAVKKVAAKEGYDIVITEQKPEIPDKPEILMQMEPNALRQLINAQSILYNSGKFDISQQVILMLDNEYLNAGKKPTP